MPLEAFPDAIHRLRKQLLDGKVVDRGEWQAMRDDRPMTQVLETHNVSFTVNINGPVSLWMEQIAPNLPWAEDHFMERVSGEPLNPGEEYKNWPWYEQGVEEHKQPGKFSHTYMERFWPTHGYEPDYGEYRRYGIRYEYGDLHHLVELLQTRPYTRQAYLPIWFPEDLTAANQGERVPCTLGYHFQMRPVGDTAALDVFYPIRSCDFFRYLRDDAYMAGRLVHWIVDQLDGAVEGNLTMHIVNLHVFADEVGRLNLEHKEEIARRLSGAH